MKCKHCGFENRAGVKFCEECGQPLKTQAGMLCPQCGFKNRAGVKFCEECGATLSAKGRARAAEAMPAAESIQAPTPIIVNAQAQGKKRRLNLLWLLLLLLLLVTCCCCLLSYEVVRAPDFIEPLLEPVLDPLRKVLPQIPFPPFNDENGKDGRGQKQQTCEDFRDQLKAADPGQETICYTTRNECYTDVVGLGDLEDIQVSYQWDQENKRTATCEERGDNVLRCYFPRNTQSDRVDYWIALEDCEEELGYSDGWLEDQDEGEFPEPPEPPLSQSSGTCCQQVEAKSVKYFRDPPEIGPLFLGFDLVCDQPWQVGDDCAEWEAWVGAERDIFWTSGSCCPDAENPNRLNCEGGIDNQKKSMTKIEMSYGDCSWEVEFQSPYYAPVEEEEDDGCPPGESMCDGSCCTDGHCSCSGGSCGCF